jgi:hypothetical protein
MERVRLALFCVVFAASVAQVACTQVSQDAYLPPQRSAGVTERASTKLSVKPESMSLLAYVGTAGERNAVVFERGYTGAFVQKTHCKGIAKASPSSGKGPRFTFTVLPKNTGTCTIVFSDEKRHEAKLHVSVSQGPGWPGGSPSPAPTPQPSGLPSPSPGASPAAIFVTYTGSGTPNVAAYDEQGNARATGSWSGSGLSPSSIVWAPALNRFFLIATNVNSSSAQNVVEAFSPQGNRLNGVFGPSAVANAGAVAFASTGTPRIYVADKTRHTIVAFGSGGALQTGVTFPSGIDTTLGGLTYDSNLARLYVANTTSGRIEAYTATGTPFPLSASFPEPVTCVGGCAPAGVTFDPDNNQLYVIWNGFGGGVAAYAEAGTPVALSGSAFAGLTSPRQMAIDTNLRFLYVTDGAGVHVFDESGNAQTLGGGAFAPSFSVTKANGIAVTNAR